MFKKSRKSDYTNSGIYRPIVLLNIIRKILKTVISNRIKYITKTYDLFSNTQYNARTDRDTKTIL